jgi:hypothetical protein
MKQNRFATPTTTLKTSKLAQQPDALYQTAVDTSRTAECCKWTCKGREVSFNFDQFSRWQAHPHGCRLTCQLCPSCIVELERSNSSRCCY